MSRQALLNVPPPLRDTHETAAMLSPRIRIGSPAASGLWPTNSSISHAVTTVPGDPWRLIVIVQVPLRSAFFLHSEVRSVMRSYLQNTFFSTRNPPSHRLKHLRQTIRVFWRAVLSPCSRPCQAPLPPVAARHLSPTSKGEIRMKLSTKLYRAVLFLSSAGLVLSGQPHSLHTKCLPARTTYERFYNFPVTLRTSLADARLFAHGPLVQQQPFLYSWYFLAETRFSLCAK